MNYNTCYEKNRLKCCDKDGLFQKVALLVIRKVHLILAISLFRIILAASSPIWAKSEEIVVRPPSTSSLMGESLKEMMPTSAVVIDKDSFKGVLDRQPVWFMGDGAEKCKGVIVHENAHFVDGAVPSAKSMFVLAEKAFNQGEFQDIAYFEPFYLKDFIAIKPKPLF